MINDIKQMNLVILHFCIKYRGNWEKIYNSIKAKDSVGIDEIHSVSKKAENLKFLTIIDENYPNNFKSIYMPPLCIFSKGNEELMQKDEKIVSVWSDINYNQFTLNNLDKNNIYAFIVNVLTDDIKDNIKKLLENDYKLIIISNQLKIEDFKIFNSKNLLVVSEIPPNTKKADIDVEQTDERLLLGISKHSLVFEKKIETFNYLLPLFKFEKRNFEVIDLSMFSENEISKYNIVKFNNNLIIN